MLPESSCSMIEFLSGLAIRGEGAADLGQDLGRADVAGPFVGVGQQRFEGLAAVGVGDRAAEQRVAPPVAQGDRRNDRQR